MWKRAENAQSINMLTRKQKIVHEHANCEQRQKTETAGTHSKRFSGGGGSLHSNYSNSLIKRDKA